MLAQRLILNIICEEEAVNIGYILKMNFRYLKGRWLFCLALRFILQPSRNTIHG